MVGRRVAALLVLGGSLAIAAAPAVSRADEPDPQKLQAAADAFDEGARAFKSGRFEEAAERFETADRLAPSPAALSNALRARKASKQGALAATLAASALARFPDDASLRDLAQSVLKTYEKNLHRVKVSCQPGCVLTIDGKLSGGDALTSAVVYLEAGPHTLAGGWPGGRTRSTRIEAQRGGSDAVSLEAPAPAASASSSAEAPPPPPPPASSAPAVSVPPSRGLSPWFFLAGVGATVVAGGLATWSGLDTLSNPGPDRVRDACAGQPRSCPLFQQGLSKERRTDALLVVTGVVAVATGVVAYFTDWKAPPFGQAPKAEAAKGRSPLRASPWASPWAAGGGRGPGVAFGVDGVFLRACFGRLNTPTKDVAVWREGR